jgi:putative nucleotidyltransferase with HDIG domain
VDTSALSDELRRVPMREGTALELLSLLDEPEVSASDVALRVGTDPVLAARCLRLANSPYFGLGGRVGDLNQAVVLLGISVIRALALTTAAGLFVDPKRMPDGFWDHSVSVAAAASLLARHRGVPVGEAFSAGLLHDVGAALLFRHDPERYDVVLTAAGFDEGRRCALERAVFGLDHAGAGAIALGAWGLPGYLVEAVRQHHHDLDAITEPLALLVSGGEAVAAVMVRDDPGVAARLDVALAAAGLDGIPGVRIVEDLRAEVARLDGLFVAAA